MKWVLPFQPQRRFVGCFRHNLFTGDWIAYPGDERMRRPRTTTEMGKCERTRPPSWSESCPFCPERSHLLPSPLFRLHSARFRDHAAPSDSLFAEYCTEFERLDRCGTAPAGHLGRPASCPLTSAQPSGGHSRPLNNEFQFVYEGTEAVQKPAEYDLVVMPNRYPVVCPTHCLVNTSAYPSAGALCSTLCTPKKHQGTSDFPCDQMVQCFRLAETLGHKRLVASGFHETLIDHPRHDFQMGDYDVTYWRMLFTAFRERSKTLSLSKVIQSVLCFKNQGFFAGASMAHPHAQLVALPLIPSQQEKRQDIAREYFVSHGECLYCHYIAQEKQEKARVVLETPQFICLVPYAAHIPYHLVILPKAHKHQFVESSDSEVTELSKMTTLTFFKLKDLLGDVDYNLIVRNSHTYRSRFQVYDPTCYFHWHVEIFPRLSSWPMAGFEFGSGILCNSHFPEDDAEALRTSNLMTEAVW